MPLYNLPNENDPRYIAAHQKVLNPLVMLMGQCAYAITCLLIYFLYKDVVPQSSMRSWILLTGVVFALVLAFDLAFIVRRPRIEEIIRIWRKIDKKISTAFDIIAVGVLLLLYPYAYESLKILTVAFFVGYVPLQMISDPENEFGNKFSTVAVLGAFAATLIWNGDLIEHYLAGLMIIYASVLFIASSVLRKVVISAVDGRLESERAAKLLETALADVSASRDAKTRFIAAVSHDLGQPLQAASLFFDQAMHAPTKRQRETAAQGVRRAFAMTDQLLSHVLRHLRLSADAVTPQFSEVKAGNLLRKLGRQFEPVARAHGKEVRWVYSSRRIVTDAELVERALSNYLANAVTHSNGTRILIGVRSDGRDFIRFCVFDDGEGVDATDVAHIFDEYYRGSDSIAGAKGGFGLGLASVRRVASLLGGEAGIASRKSRGARFYLRLPASGSV